MKRFSISAAIKFGFVTLFDHFVFFIATALAYIGSLIAGVMAVIMITGLTFAAVWGFQLPQIMQSEQAKEIMRAVLHDGIRSILAAIIFFLALIFLIALYRLLELGFTRIYLDMVDYENSSIKQLYSCTYLIIRSLIAAFLYKIIVGIGLILFVIPGIIFAIKYGFFLQVLIDKNAGIFDAFSQSNKIAYGVKWDLLGLWIIFGIINIVAALFGCVGLLITMPATGLAFTYVYRELEKQTFE